MIKKSFKKALLGIGQDESGALLISCLLVMILLTIVGGAALTNSVIETKISANYKKSSAAFYIADAGIEAAKADILSRPNLNDALAGNGPLLTNVCMPGGVGGIYNVTIADDPNDGDADIWVDDNNIAIITSTGTDASGAVSKIEAYIDYSPLEFPGAISYPDNGDADNNDHLFRIELNTFTVGSGIAANGDDVLGVVITGFDTLDGTRVPGNGPGPHTRGLSSQESAAFNVAGGPTWANFRDRGTLETMPAPPEEICSTGPDDGDEGDPIGKCFRIVSGTSPWGTNVSEGLNEAGLEELYDELRAKAWEADSSLVKTGQGTNINIQGAIGSSGVGNGKIAVIENGDNNIEFINDITGYGILLVKGRIEVGNGATFEWHGLVINTCRGDIELKDGGGGTLDIWGGLIMLNNAEGGCNGSSGDAEFLVDQGKLHIYYSTEAIDKYVKSFVDELDVIAWREIDT